LSSNGSKKKWPKTVSEARGWIDFDNPHLSIRDQCRLLGLHRSNLYYEPAPESEENLHLMRLMDEEHLRRPARGSRQMVDFLMDEGFVVNRKRVQRLMRKMGIEGLSPKRRTTLQQQGHLVYPYLLRNLTIERPNQVWASDITYIPMRRGFLYLVAVMDWHSRHVLAWRLSNSMDVDFCIEALKDSLQHGTPEIFNTDQGAQFTSRDFTDVLKGQDISISMDGKGRAIDNVMIERLWRTVKYEEVYLKEYENGTACHQGLAAYFDYYCYKRRHQSLGRQTPWSVYRSRK
jgi:putative transposase